MLSADTDPSQTMTEKTILEALSADKLMAHIIVLDLALERARDHSATSQQPDDNLTA